MEIDYKEKYMLAMERAKNFIENGDEGERTIAESIFAGLMEESKDERIRKALMQNLKERFGTKGNMGEGLDMPDVLAWLEKQGEKETKGNEREIPNSAWSEEDEIRLKHILRLLDVKDDKKYLLMFGLNSLQDLEKDIAWLKSLRPQPKQSLDEDTQQWIDTIIKDYEDWYDADKDHRATIQAKINILKSLRPQSQWKPSDKCIEALEKTLKYFHMSNAHGETIDGLKELLEQLLEQLKRLREE